MIKDRSDAFMFGFHLRRRQILQRSAVVLALASIGYLVVLGHAAYDRLMRSPHVWQEVGLVKPLNDNRVVGDLYASGVHDNALVVVMHTKGGDTYYLLRGETMSAYVDSDFTRLGGLLYSTETSLEGISLNGRKEMAGYHNANVRVEGNDILFTALSHERYRIVPL